MDTYYRDAPVRVHSIASGKHVAEKGVLVVGHLDRNEHTHGWTATVFTPRPFTHLFGEFNPARTWLREQAQVIDLPISLDEDGYVHAHTLTREEAVDLIESQRSKEKRAHGFTTDDPVSLCLPSQTRAFCENPSHHR